jgi:hypothetical protein
MSTTNGTPVEMLIDGVWILATAIRGDIMGNPVTRYYDMDGNRRYGRTVRMCPVFGPEPHREYCVCACGFRRVRGSMPVGVHAKCGQ